MSKERTKNRKKISWIKGFNSFKNNGPNELNKIDIKGHHYGIAFVLFLFDLWVFFKARLIEKLRRKAT